MKLSTLALASLTALALPVNAATLTVMNISGAGNDLAILDNAGNPLSSGFLGLYAFGAGAGSPPGDVGAAMSNGANGLVTSVPFTPAGAGGAFFLGLPFANPGPTNGAGQWDGQNLYLMIGNGPDAAGSDQIALLPLGIASSGSDAPPPGWNGGTTIINTDISPLFGNVGPAVTLDWTNAIGNPAYSTPGLSLDLVPEPSSSLLFGLAGLALLIRRKR